MSYPSLANYKGGVGKTTVTANIGAELTRRGYRTLLIDLDPQASLTFSFVQPDYWQKNLALSGTIKSWYDSAQAGAPLRLASLRIKPTVVNRYFKAIANGKTLDLIPSHLGLINVDLELASGLAGASMQQAKRNYMRVHRRLAEGLAEPEFSDYDVILIDCPPNFNIVTKTAIVASSHVLIPAKADYLSTLGIDYLKRNLDELVKDYNDYATVEVNEASPTRIAPSVLGVVFTMIQIYAQQPVSAQRPYIAQTRGLGLPVFQTYLRENKSLFAGAAEEGSPVVLNGYAQAREHVAEIREMVNEFTAKLGI